MSKVSVVFVEDGSRAEVSGVWFVAASVKVPGNLILTTQHGTEILCNGQVEAMLPEGGNHEASAAVIEGNAYTLAANFAAFANSKIELHEGMSAEDCEAEAALNF